MRPVLLALLFAACSGREEPPPPPVSPGTAPAAPAATKAPRPQLPRPPDDPVPPDGELVRSASFAPPGTPPPVCMTTTLRVVPKVDDVVAAEAAPIFDGAFAEAVSTGLSRQPRHCAEMLAEETIWARCVTSETIVDREAFSVESRTAVYHRTVDGIGRQMQRCEQRGGRWWDTRPPTP